MKHQKLPEIIGLIKNWFKTHYSEQVVQIILLEVYTREAFPEQWAITQNNLGIAYFYRICGARS